MQPVSALLTYIEVFEAENVQHADEGLYGLGLVDDLVDRHHNPARERLVRCRTMSRSTSSPGAKKHAPVEELAVDRLGKRITRIGGLRGLEVDLDLLPTYHQRTGGERSAQALGTDLQQLSNNLQLCESSRQSERA